jgi:aryl-alcohol dehydrogenase-like predicted oxidoreductase
VCMCVCVCTELGIALVPYSPLGHGFFAGYKPRAENQDSCSVCSLSSSNFPTLLSSACCLEFDV